MFYVSYSNVGDLELERKCEFGIGFDLPIAIFVAPDCQSRQSKGNLSDIIIRYIGRQYENRCFESTECETGSFEYSGKKTNRLGLYSLESVCERRLPRQSQLFFSSSSLREIKLQSKGLQVDCANLN